MIEFSDGTAGPSACLRCADSPCLRYSPSELQIQNIGTFPADGTTDVCVTGSLRWPDGQAAPVIDGSLCISCGVCVLRCPVGALSLGSDGALLADADTQHFERLATVMSESQSQAERSRFAAAAHDGQILDESDALLDHAYLTLTRLLPSLPARVPTLLTRNLLLAVGYKAAMRRLGDVNVRMDLVIWESPSGKIGTVEVEFNQTALIDTPRNIIDNLAVLITRYKVPVDRASGLVVALSLPNQRSEFWQVMEDLRTVLKVRTSVLTVGVLMFFVWSRRTLDLALDGSFETGPGSHSIRTGAERKLRRRLRIRPGSGAVESTK
jgi:Fe-S-cluster-containing hydrogenase component 2